MARDSLVREVEKWRRLFFLSLFVAFAILLAQIALDWDFLDWPRAGAWTSAGICSILEGRALRRIEQDGWGAIFRGLGCFCIAIIAIL